VRAALIKHKIDGTYVRLSRRISFIDVSVGDETSGRALIAAMRMDSTSTVARYTMYMGHRAATRDIWLASIWVLGGCLAIFALDVASGLTAAYMAAGMAVAYGWRAFTRAEVRLGSDGLLIRRWVGKSRFVPFSAIESASTQGANVGILLHDGTAIHLHVGTGKPTGTDAEEAASQTRRDIVARVNEALTRAGRPLADASAALLVRAGRSTKDWLLDLTITTGEAASYRVSAVPREELWRMVEDPALSPTARAGAAVVLREALDEEERTRLRSAAEACAAPRLRVALDAVATAEGDMNAALDELDDEAASGSASRDRA
jgi:hypothetical protein